MTLAIIDLGTNIFHLRIVHVLPNNSFEEIFRKSRFVKLASAGIGTIGAEPFQRGIECLQDYAQILSEYQVDETRAIGTAALRTASNGAVFVQTVKEKTGLDITLIDGDQEAHYIHKGVELAVPFDSDKKLIMDIGGGSVEFIIADLNRVYWAQSFPIGMAVVYVNFHHNDPISAAEIEAIHQFFDAHLVPLVQALGEHEITDLVGTKGTFDILVAQFSREKIGPHCAVLDIATLHELPAFFSKVIHSARTERLAMPEIPDDRVDMIVVGMVLIQYILNLSKVPRLLVSDYDLKEGVLTEMANGG